MERLDAAAVGSVGCGGVQPSVLAGVEGGGVGLDTGRRWLSEHRGPMALVNQATERVERLYRQL